MDNLDSVGEALKGYWGVVVSLGVGLAAVLGIGLRRFGIKFFSPAVSKEMADLRKTMESAAANQQGTLDSMRQDVSSTHEEMIGVRSDLDDIKTRVTRIETDSGWFKEAIARLQRDSS